MLGPPGRHAKRGGVSAGGFDGIDGFCKAAKHGRIARSAAQSLICQRDQTGCMKRRGKTFQALRSHLPVAIAPRAAQQIDLPTRTFDKSRAQFAKQRRVVSGRRSEVGINRIA
jgi:hypothetical protein